MKMRPKDELYIFIYDKDQIYIPSVSRVYGSDFRKISDVSRQWTKSNSIYSVTHQVVQNLPGGLAQPDVSPCSNK